MQMIFQDPYPSINPGRKIIDIVAEGIDACHMAASEKRDEKVVVLFRRVGPREEHTDRFPHKFTGGQRQQSGIARAFAVDPDFTVCDETIISALDW